MSDLRYKRGTFAHIIQPDTAVWQKNIDFARSLPGVDHVELWLEYLPNDAELAQLKQMLSGIDVTIHAPCQGVSLATTWKELAEISLQRMQQTAGIATELGASVLTLHTGTYNRHEDRNAMTARMGKMLERLASSTDTTIAIENIPPRTGGQFEAFTVLSDFDQIVAAAPSIKLTIDVGHAMLNGEDPIAVIRDYRQHLVNIHLHDKPEGQRDHQTLGTGVLDMKAFTTALEDIDYRGYVALETITDENTQSSWNYWDQFLK